MKLNKSSLVANLQYELFFAIVLYLLPIYKILIIEKNFENVTSLLSVLVILIIMFVQIQIFKGKE